MVVGFRASTQPTKRFLWWLGFVPQPNLQNDFDGGWVSCLNPTYKTIFTVVGFRDRSTQPTKNGFFPLPSAILRNVTKTQKRL
jgi:hypothetical protein